MSSRLRCPVTGRRSRLCFAMLPPPHIIYSVIYAWLRYRETLDSQSAEVAAKSFTSLFSVEGKKNPDLSRQTCPAWLMTCRLKKKCIPFYFSPTHFFNLLLSLVLLLQSSALICFSCTVCHTCKTFFLSHGCRVLLLRDPLRTEPDPSQSVCKRGSAFPQKNVCHMFNITLYLQSF